MRTANLLPVSHSMHCARGVCSKRGVCSGGVCSRGSAPGDGYSQVGGCFGEGVSAPGEGVSAPGVGVFIPACTVRGPESSLITWTPYKVIIRVLQLVLLYVLVSIGWHHCRTQDMIGPRNWSTVMWPAPIGWWRRVSPAINTTQAQGQSVCCLVLWELVRAWGSTPPSAGSTVHRRQQPLLRDSPPVEHARPLYIPYCVLPWSQPNPARRSGAPGDTRYLCVVYKELVMYSWINV